MALPTPEEIQGVAGAPEQPRGPEVQLPSPEAVTPAETEPLQFETRPEPEAAAPLEEVEHNPEIPPELVEQVQQYVDIAFSQSPEAAVQKARETGNAALIDAVHATLSKLYGELEARGKLKRAA